jgi:4-hydroxy-tetrahydrodipicolinate synthase
MLKELHGTGAALVTPFDEDLRIDYPGFKRLLDFIAEGGVDYYVVNGTTGEAATTNKTEKHALLDFIRANNPKNLPIVYGTGGYDTADIVEHVQEMDWTGVSALLSVSPYYNKPSQRGIIAHYHAVADACPRPVIMYNVPKRTGSNMTAATTIALADHPNIAGIKEASGDLGQIIDILASVPRDFLVISGDDMLTTAMVSLGGVGVISVMANAFPREMSEMCRRALLGDYPEANKLLFRLSRINPWMYTESNPVGVKEALALLGICRNFVRLPLVTGSDALREELRKGIRRLQGN